MTTEIPYWRPERLPDLKRATDGASGYDLTASTLIDHPHGAVSIPRGKRARIPCGLHLAMPLGVEAQVRSRSGLADKRGVAVLNAPGTVDADFRGEVSAVLINLAHEDEFPEPFFIMHGDRIAQLVFAPVILPDLVHEVEHRGERFVRWLVDLLGVRPGCISVGPFVSGHHVADIWWPIATLATLWERVAAAGAHLSVQTKRDALGERTEEAIEAGGERAYRIMVPSSAVDAARITEPWQPVHKPPFVLRRGAELGDLPPSSRGSGGFGSTGMR